VLLDKINPPPEPAASIQKSFSHQTFNTSKNNLVDSTNVGLESTEKCSKLKEILEKFPMLRKVSEGSHNRQREGNERAGSSSQSSGSNRRPDRQEAESSPRL
jgi:hypothetical protein